MSKIEVNTVEPQCGTTLTLGANNDTVALGTGAAFSGGIDAVKWETTPQTGSFGALAGRGYFMNTTSGALTLTLPASPNSGDVVAVKDYAGTFDTNNVTVARNSSPIDAGTSDAVLDTKNLSVLFIYVDGTQGWKAVQSDNGFYGPEYVTATGGTITTSGNFKIHTFTGPGTFQVTSAGNLTGSNSVDYLVAAGGGGGGDGRANNFCGGGGGGAGGYRESSGASSGCYTRSPLGACVSALPVSATSYPITVGAGGVGASGPGPNSSAPVSAASGSNSIFSTITSTGGGFGGSAPPSGPSGGATGGSGGGGGEQASTGAAGNTPPVSPPQGNPGGNSFTPQGGIGSGGGATTAGVNSGASSTGAGGAGATSSINGTPTARAGGGGAGGVGGSTTGGVGGSGGGGAGGNHPASNGTSGTANTGGGGGAQGSTGSPGASSAISGSGGSGIVIIRYKFQ